MKKKDLADTRNKEIKDLKKLAEEKKLELAKTEVKIRSGEEKNVKKAGGLRREIAQILTIIQEKELIEQEKK